MNDPKTSRDRALYRHALAAERVEREATRDAKRRDGTLKSPSSNRKKRKHGR